ncbi:MAG: DUF4091 domain-containing protein [Armatimonadetes bacterium]|nr:DUF4091 domain-containing protein [Armatimonadota bacterium]
MRKILLLGVSLLLAASAFAQTANVPNPSFERGGTTPEGWSLSGGAGARVRGGRTGQWCLRLTGTGEESQFWKCDSWQPKPGQTYRLTFWARSEGASGGCLVSGPDAANRDFSLPGKTWTRYTRVFVAPRTAEPSVLRLGVWATRGEVFFDDVEIRPVVALHGTPGEPELGEGEQISGGSYRFRAPLDGDGSNYARALVDYTARFNSNRWVMTDGTYVTYRHRVAGHRQRGAHVAVEIGYYQSGRLVVEASRDGKAWQVVGTVAGKEAPPRLDLPEALFPAETIWVRLRGEGEQRSGRDSDPGSFQVQSYTYEAALEGTPRPATGRTAYLEVERATGPIQVAVQSLGSLRPGSGAEARLRLTNPGNQPARLNAVLRMLQQGRPVVTRRAAVTVPAGGQETLRLPYSLTHAGDWRASLQVVQGQRTLFAATTEFSVPALFAADYGYLVSTNETAAVWWAEAPHKISRERPAPTVRRPEVHLSAARHEYEPFQVVIRPRKALSGVTAQMTDFVGPGGARISRENVQICRVAYVNVSRPTDNVGVVGAWPDPLPPLTGPFDVAANSNQPLWVTVYVPAGTPPGRYTSRLRLRAGSWSQEVPIQLQVWNFTLPQETHVRSAFGFDPAAVQRYHNLETREELEQVVDRYLQNFAAHRISPYNPTPFAPIKVSFGQSPWTGGRQVTEQAFEGQRCLLIVDDDPKVSVTADSGERIPVDPTKEYRLSFAARTEKDGQPYQITVQCYDVAGTWMSGRNQDFRLEGSTTWRQETISLRGRLPEGARSVSLVLRPAPWSEQGEATGTAWFDAVSFRQAPDGPELVQDGGFERTLDPSQVKVDFAEFDRAAERAFNELRFNTFSLPIQGMGSGTFHSRQKGRIGGYEQGTPEYEALFTAYVRQLQDHLEAKGWLDKAYIYWFDEPEERDYEFVKEGMALLKRAAPKLARMLTEQVEPALAGSVDIWCPLTASYDPAAGRERQAAGEHVWWYVCTGPKAPYVTLFIDHPGIEMRMWLWQTVKYDVEGILVWHSNYWTSGAAFPPPAIQNPWEDAMSYVSGYDYVAGMVGYWGNGDGRFIYPPNQDPENDRSKHLGGPVDSIRWEMLREGIEDYEYFWLLREAIREAKERQVPAATIAAAEKLLTVPEEICVDMTHFTLDPQPLYAHRAKIAAAIERLSAQR